MGWVGIQNLKMCLHVLSGHNPNLLSPLLPKNEPQKQLTAIKITYNSDKHVLHIIFNCSWMLRYVKFLSSEDMLFISWKPIPDREMQNPLRVRAFTALSRCFHSCLEISMQIRCVWPPIRLGTPIHSGFEYHSMIFWMQPFSSVQYFLPLQHGFLKGKYFWLLRGLEDRSSLLSLDPGHSFLPKNWKGFTYLKLLFQ